MDVSETQNSARAYFEANETRFDRLTASLTLILTKVADTAGVKVHHISARKKSLDSYLEKFDRKQHLARPTDVQDLVGGRVVTLFRSDLRRLEDKLGDVFVVVGTENKIEDADEDSFGYMSVHSVCRFNSSLSGPHYDGLHDVEFEIQLRTILMDAWANVSHHIDYKGESSIPKELRKDFNALSALFYVADSSFERFYEASQNSKQAATDDLAALTASEIPLNADTLAAALKKFFPDRTPPDDSFVSGLMEDISAYTTIETVGALENVVDEYRGAAERFELENPPKVGHSEMPERFAQVGMLRILLNIAVVDYANRLAPQVRDRYARYR
ncbi:GTP pyrophosphokinase [Herbiconiux daphne]|uniref:RelA/SpoT domain-containing protein n=1 Tax=Herbiconiux daphne TaxID=2970914 RepID=A0ABT2H0Y4_9MICO|nr:hypothetical protein [Herbiconiux daphne]MCS5733587.1 hypothetical protein [Herbiconiux daphne]